MTVSAKRLGLEGSDDIDIIDVKCDPVMVAALREKVGFRPAYHMNKTTWITALLNGTADDVEIKSLISLSYELTSKNKKQVDKIVK